MGASWRCKVPRRGLGGAGAQDQAGLGVWGVGQAEKPGGQLVLGRGGRCSGGPKRGPERATWAWLRVPGPASAELVCNRTFDKYSCWPDTPPNTTASISCPWYLPWYHKGNRRGPVGVAQGLACGQGTHWSLPPVQHGFVYKRCGPDGQWVRGPRGQPWRDASQCQMDEEEVKVQVSLRLAERRPVEAGGGRCGRVGGPPRSPA